MSAYLLLLCCSAIVVCQLSQNSAGPPVTMRMQAERTAEGVVFEIEISNEGSQIVFLEEVRKGSRDPFAINLEQGRAGSWIEIGPHRDSRAVGLFALKANEKVRKRVTLSDPWLMPMASRHNERVSIIGNHRASVRLFRNKEHWETFLKDGKDAPARIYSKVITIAPANKH